MTLQDILPIKTLADSERKQVPLLRRFTVVGLVAMLFTATLLIHLYRQDQISSYEKVAASENERTLAFLMRALSDQINDYVIQSKKLDVKALQADSTLGERIFSILDEVSEDNVLKVKIYNLSGMAVYSSDLNEIGGGSKNQELLDRALHGATLNKIEHRDEFVGRIGPITDIDISLTYKPITHAGIQIGVIEIYNDASPIFNRLRANYVKIVLIVSGIFGSLFFALFFGISRADRDVKKWQEESEQAEDELLKQKQFSDAIINSLPGVFYLITPQGKFARINQQFIDVTGYSKDECSRIGALDLFEGADKNLIAQKMQQVFETGIASAEAEVTTKSGKKVPYYFTGHRINLDDQIYLVGVGLDITERRSAEMELRIAASAFETQDAILITDAKSNIVRVNRAFTEITGYSAEEVLGQNPRMMNSGQHERSFYIEMWQQLLHSGCWAGEIWDRRKSGQIYPKWLAISAVKDAAGETTHYVAIFSDITARKQAEEMIHNLAFYDALTKLPNRRLFLDRLQAALAASMRRKDFGAVLFIDLDRFKALNDTLGHEYGDLLLIEVGVRIKACVREMDTVARFGGDEFVVLIGEISKHLDDASHKVAVVAEKIRETLSSPYKLKEHEHHCSPSIGISLFHDNDVPMDVLIEHADMAMYQAKNAGRNTVRFFDPVMQHNVAAHDALENDLHHAIELNQLHLHYQIQVDNNNRPMGAEAFLRWDHPERGMLMPGHFLPIAEESNMVIDIGRWVLQTAYQQLALWKQDEITRDLTLTVNISAKHFAHTEFVDEIANMLKAGHVDPTRLKLELSERLVLIDLNSTIAKIEALKSLGVRLSMDNFSTVYSSLSYLKQLSSDQLKIHKEFVHGISQGGNDVRLVETVINLAKSLDLHVFAEGVETEEERAFLHDHDCNAYQGYLFGKPVAIEEFEKTIRKF